MVRKILYSIIILLFLLAGALYFLLRSWGMLREPVYDTLAPDIPTMQSPAVLVLHKTNSYIHKEAIPAATDMLGQLAKEQGWQIYQTDNAATHNIEDLDRFDVVVWNNTSGDILTAEQRTAFKSWLMSGGNWLGLHAAGGDPIYDWRWYVDTLLAAQFTSHTMSPQNQDADVIRSDDSPLTAHLPHRWRVQQEEWYAFDRNPRDTGSTILLAMDEDSYDTSEFFFPEASMPGEHPIAWTHAIGEGRMIYSAIGHTAATYALPEYRQFVTNAINSMIEAQR